MAFRASGSGLRLLVTDRAALTLLHALDWTVVLRRAEAASGQGTAPGTLREAPDDAWATELSLLALHAAVLLPASVRCGILCSLPHYILFV